MPKFTLSYELENHGWANVSFADNYQKFETSVSYLHDSVLDLVNMALDLKKGLTTSEAIFLQEPGETRLVVTVESENAHYEVRVYRDWASWGMTSLHEYEVLMSGLCRTSRMVQQIHSTLNKLYEDIGPKEYKKRWIEHDFPEALYQKLNMKLCGS